MRNNIGMRAIPIVIRICRVLTLPINNNSKQLAPSNNAVERFAGAINKQVIATGAITG
jgi:hypothetical protein